MLLGPVSWLRECSVLYQANQLCSPWRHNAGFPLSVICMQNSGGQVPAGTIQVLARMVPAKAVNWLQLASKCWFYPYRYSAVAVANISPSIFRAKTTPLITLQQILPVSHQHQVSLLYGSLKLHQLLSWHRDSSTKPWDRASVLFASRKQHFTVLWGCGAPWSLTLAGKVSQALTVGSVQGQSTYKCQEMQECQGSDKVECHKVP